MVVSDSLKFPVLDALVAVHYDNLPSDDFVRKQILKRKMSYRSKGKIIYNLSTRCNTKVRKNYLTIGSLTGSLERNYDLNYQLALLEDDIRRKDSLQNVEVVGLSWWICAEITCGYLEKKGYVTKLNYDCTDLVYDHCLLSKINDISVNGKAIPEINPAVLSRYLKK